MRNTAKSQSTSNTKETGLKMYTQHNSHGTFMPLKNNSALPIMVVYGAVARIKRI
jgi:hypothetical protein